MRCNLQNGGASKVAAITKIGCSHHVLGVEHLLGQFWNSNGTERVCATAGERSKADHEEVQTWEWDHVDSQFAKIRVQLTRETEASGDTGHHG
jgi:hypothetical protein